MALVLFTSCEEQNADPLESNSQDSQVTDGQGQGEAQPQYANALIHAWPDMPSGLALPAADVPQKDYYAQVLINQKLPNIEVDQWVNDRPDFEGKLVLIDFWATWCPPCKEAIPELNELKKAFGDKLAIIGISDEDLATVNGMVEPKIEYASAIDQQKRLNDVLGVQGIPHVVIADQYGYVRWQGFPLDPSHRLTKDVVQQLIDVYGAKE